MTKKLKLMSTAAISLILIAITVAVFFLGTVVPRVALDFTALTFVLISEIAVFGCLLYLVLSETSSNKRIIRVGILCTLGAYWTATVLLAFFRGAFAETPNKFTIVNLILVGISAVLCILLNIAASRVQAIDETTNNARLFLQGIEKALFALKTNSEYSEFAKELNELYEKVRFSDKVGVSSFDRALSDEVDNLRTALDDLTEKRKENVAKIVTQILDSVDHRNMELAQGKRGGF